MHILDSNTSQAFIDRLESLSEDTIPKWGKMNSTEMLKHCRLAMEVPLGRLKLKPNFIFKLLFGKMIKKKVTDDSIYKPSTPTANEFKVTDANLDFQTEKELVIRTIHEFSNFSDKKLDETPHQLFGKMNSTEWRISQWKHLRHHWEQFGI